MHVPRRRRKHFGWETFAGTRNDNGDRRTYFNGFPDGRLELWYQQLYPALLSYAVKYIGEEMEFLAEDCVQNAIFNAWKRREHFDLVYRAIRALPPKECQVFLRFVQYTKWDYDGDC